MRRPEFSLDIYHIPLREKKAQREFITSEMAKWLKRNRIEMCPTRPKYEDLMRRKQALMDRSDKRKRPTVPGLVFGKARGAA